jgi:hypothetical protein
MLFFRVPLPPLSLNSIAWPSARWLNSTELIRRLRAA